MAIIQSRAKPSRSSQSQPPSPAGPIPLGNPAAPADPPRYRSVVVTRAGGRTYYGLDTKGGLVVNRGNNRFFTSKGERIETWFSDELVDELIGWRELAPGCYERTYDDTDVVAPRPAFEVRITPEFELSGQRFPPAEHLVCVPFVSKLKTRFPNPSLNLSNLRAFTAVGDKEFPTLHASTLADSVLWFTSSVFMAQELLRTTKVCAIVDRSAKVPVAGTRSFVQPSTVDGEAYLRGIGQDVDHGAFRRQVGEADTNDQILTDNGLFTIEDARGYTPIKVPNPNGAPTTGIAGEFDTKANAHPKLYFTQHMGVKGSKDFTLLDKSGENFAKAMSRLYKARDNDEELRANQAKMLQHLRVDRDLLSDCANDVPFAEELIHSPDVRGTPGMTARYCAAQLIAQPIEMTVLERAAKFYRTLVAIVLLPLYYLCAFTARAVYVGSEPTLLFQGRHMFRSFPKRKLYQSWYAAIVHDLGHSYEQDFNGQVEAKFKTELAKPGKHGRLYVTYGKSILYSGWIFDLVKKYMCGVQELASTVRSMMQSAGAADAANFAPAEFRVDIVKALDEEADFNDTIPHEGLSCRMFSDDMSSVYVTPDREILYFDTDISSCDAGNTFAMFYLLAVFMRVCQLGAYIRANYRRLRQKIICRNPSNPAEKVVLRPRTIYQGSGCPETTVVNNVASFCISVSFYVHIAFSNWQHRDEPELAFDTASERVRTEVLTQAAAAVGHKITIDWRVSPAETQFLKYSPLLTRDGVKRVNSRNLGAVLRNVGRHVGDLSAKRLGVSKKQFRNMAPADRAEIYISNVVRGLVHEPGNVVLDALRERFTSARVAEWDGFYGTRDTTHRAGHYIPITGLQERYGGEEHEWLQLAETIRTLQFGQIRFSSLHDEIMRIDYGL